MKRIILIIGLAVLVGVSALLAGKPTETAAANSLTLVSFAKSITLTSPARFPSSLAAGDLNGDGLPDLAVVSIENDQGLFHALGKGDGRFGHWSNKGGTGNAPGFVLFADVDKDGNLDAVTTDSTQSFIVVAFGDGKGHLSRGIQLSTGTGCANVQLEVADLNSDGFPDIVGTCLTGDSPGRIFVLLGEGHRKFKKAMHFSSGGHAPYGIAVGDLNHDGIPDLVVANNGSQLGGHYGNVAVLLGKGDGTFEKPVQYNAGKVPYGLVLGDFNKDGNLDVAVVGPTVIGKRDVFRVLLGNGDGTFGRAKAYPSGLFPISIVSADFNGDGIPDLAVANYTNPKPCHASIMLGNGDGTFQPPVHFPVGVSPTQLVIADFNHDGKPDIATINGGDSTISVLLNTTQFPASPPGTQK
jgi:hypothetical protein